VAYRNRTAQTITITPYVAYNSLADTSTVYTQTDIK
jgi:hypothetical protein